MLNKYLSKILKFSVPLCSLIFAANRALAADQSTDYGLSKTASAAGLSTSINAAQFLGQIAGGALAISGSIFLFLIIYGGIYIMTGQGDEGKIKKGKEIITWAIIGAVILGGAYAITSLVFQAISK